MKYFVIPFVLFFALFLSACSQPTISEISPTPTLDSGLTQVDGAYSDLVKVDAWVDRGSQAENNIIIIYSSLYYQDQNVSREAAEISWPDPTKEFGKDYCYCQGGYGRVYCFIEMDRFSANTTIPITIKFPFLGRTYIRTVEYLYDPLKTDKLVLFGLK
ncbi:MAG: YajG family lipoprotein [Anaerolineaceae bacterium]